MPSRRAPAVAAVVLLLASVAVALTVIPFDVLPGAHPVIDVARDFTAAQMHREVSYHDAVRPPAYASLVLSLLVAGALGLTRLGGAIVAGCGARWWLQVPLGTLALTAIGRLATLPLGWRAEQVQRDYGLSTRTWFNSFTPLSAGQLRTDLLALCRAGGRAGAGRARGRCVAADLRAQRLRQRLRLDAPDRPLRHAAEAGHAGRGRGDVGHELGHAQEDDVLHGTVIGMLGGAAGVCVLALLLTWAPLLRRAGASGPDDPRLVPLVLFLVAAGTLLVSPAINVASRQVETRADLHALEATRDPDAFVASFQRLGTANLSDLDPHPLAVLLFATHPTSPERIAFARAWQAQQR